MKCEAQIDKINCSFESRLLFIGNYYYYEMCCLKRKVSAPKRPKIQKPDFH